MTVYCPNCWSQLAEGQRLCVHCHQDVSAWDDKTFEAKLLQAISHPEPMTQNRAVYLLGEKKSSQALGSLAELFRQTSSPFLKSEIVEATAKIGGDAAYSLLIEALRDPSFMVRGKAVEALEKSSGRDTVERELKHCLDDPSSYVREMARKVIDSLWGRYPREGLASDGTGGTGKNRFCRRTFDPSAPAVHLSHLPDPAKQDQQSFVQAPARSGSQA